MTTQDNPTNYLVILMDYGDMKINVIKEVRDEASLSLSASKDLVESAPSIVKANLSEIEAKALKARLAKHGATVRIGRKFDDMPVGVDSIFYADDESTTDPDYNIIIDAQLDRIKSLWEDRNSWNEGQGEWTWKKRERFEMLILLTTLRDSTATLNGLLKTYVSDIDNPSSAWKQLLDIYINPKVTDPFNALKEAGGVSPAHLAETRNRIARILNIESPFTKEEGESASK